MTAVRVSDPFPVKVTAAPDAVSASADLAGAAPGPPGPASTVPGPAGPQGLPGTGAVPADSAVAGYISTEGTSATKTALAASVAETATTTVAQLKVWARSPDMLVAGTISRDANGAVTSAPVLWPDGAPGSYTTLTTSSTVPGAVDSYKITYGTAGLNNLSGVSVPLSNDDLTVAPEVGIDRAWQLVVDAKAGWVRFGMPAFTIELEPGVRDWAGYERAATSAKARGLNILGLLTSLPRWANSTNTGGDWHDGATTQARRDAFTAYAVDAATRFKGVIDTWEIWNEANSGNYWAPEMTNAADYVLLLQQVYPAIKAANPNAKIIATGCARPRILTSAAFYQSVYDNGGKNYFDYAGMHPYPNSGTNANTGEMSLLPNLVAVMNANGDTNKPLWGTECGMATAGSGSVTEAQHGPLYTDLNNFWFNNIGTHTGPLFMYSLRDKQPPGATTAREDYFGMTHYDFSPKPSFYALQTRNAINSTTTTLKTFTQGQVIRDSAGAAVYVPPIVES